MDDKFFEILFQNTRNQYRDFRKYERDKIKKYLESIKDKSFTVENTKLFQGCKGCDNWLGLDVFIDENGTKKTVFISLQAFGKNTNNGNKYVVMDRIGLYKYTNHNGKLETENALNKMKPAGISLPMNEKKLKDLVKALREIK